MIEVSDEMLGAWHNAFNRAAEEAVRDSKPYGTGDIARAALAAVLAIVERDYDVRLRVTDKPCVRLHGPHDECDEHWDWEPDGKGGWREVTPPGDIVQQPLTSGPPAEPDHGRLP